MIWGARVARLRGALRRDERVVLAVLDEHVGAPPRHRRETGTACPNRVSLWLNRATNSIARDELLMHAHVCVEAGETGGGENGFRPEMLDDPGKQEYRYRQRHPQPACHRASPRAACWRARTRPDALIDPSLPQA